MTSNTKLSPTLLDTYKAWLDTHSNGMNDYLGYERGTMFRRHLAFMETVQHLPAGEAKDKLTAIFKDTCLLLMFATEPPEVKEKIIRQHTGERAVEAVKDITLRPSQMSIVDQELVSTAVKGNILYSKWRNYRWRIIVEFIPEDTGAK